MKIGQFHDSLEALFSTDEQFIAELGALGLGSGGAAAVPVVTFANRDIASFPLELMPAWVFVPGDGEARSGSNSGSDFLDIGGSQLTVRTSLELALVWHQQDFLTGYRQRRDLPGAIASLLLRNQQSIAGVDGCWLESWQNDRSIRHPVQTAAYTIAAELTLEG